MVQNVVGLECQTDEWRATVKINAGGVNLDHMVPCLKAKRRGLEFVL